jgi:Domain of unknown function (DUF6285)
MHSTVSRDVVLKALAEFLSKNVRPVMQDPKLSFQVLIAESLLQGLASESASESANLTRELTALRLVSEKPGANESALSDTEKRSEIEALTNALCAEVSHGNLQPVRFNALLTHLKTTLKEDIMTTNPRFLFAEDLCE